MLTADQIAKLQQALLVSLQVSFQQVSIHRLKDLASKLDEELLDFARRQVPSYVASFISESKPGPLEDTFHTGSRTFSVTILPDLKNFERVNFAFLEISCARRAIPIASKSGTKFETTGRFKRISLLSSKTLNVDHEAAFMFITAILTTGCRWFDEQIGAATATVETPLVRDLYAYWRRVCLEQSLLKYFWFAAASQGLSFALYDSTKAADAIRCAAAMSRNVRLSPVRITSEMLNYCVPFETVAARDAISTQKPVLIDLSHSQFRERFPELAEAEMINLGGSIVCVFPIFAIGDSCLVAGFPAGDGDRHRALEALLSAHRGALESRFRTSLGDLDAILQIVRRRRSSLSDAGLHSQPNTSPPAACAAELKETILKRVKIVVQMNEHDDVRRTEAINLQRRISEVLFQFEDFAHLELVAINVTKDLANADNTPQKLHQWLGWLQKRASCGKS